MVSESHVRSVHLPGFVLSTLASIVTLAIAASLVKFYNDHGYPDVSYRDRIRITLVAAVLAVPISLWFAIGGVMMMGHRAMSLLVHLVSLAITFILFIIGVSSLTALTHKTDCGNPLKGGDFPRCKTVKGLVAVAWIETVILFILLVFVTMMAVRARRTVGIKNGTMLDA